MMTGMIRVRSVLFLSAFSILMGSSAQAASITVDAGGILLGAKNVIVNGSSYDVEFIDGTCAQVFGACDVANFAFTTESDAQAASSALLDQVFLDGPLGNLDSDLKLTNGCITALDIDQCFAVTPYGMSSNVDARFSAAINTAHPLLSDSTVVGLFPVQYDATDDVEGVFAKWTAVPQSVPDHTSTLRLVGLSVLIMLTLRRVA